MPQPMLRAWRINFERVHGHALNLMSAPPANLVLSRPMPTREQNQHRKAPVLARYLAWRQLRYTVDPPSHLRFWALVAVMVVVMQAVIWLLKQPGAASNFVNGLVATALIALALTVVFRKR